MCQTTPSIHIDFVRENTAIKVVGVSMNVSKRMMIQMDMMIMHVLVILL